MKIILLASFMLISSQSLAGMIIANTKFEKPLKLSLNQTLVVKKIHTRLLAPTAFRMLYKGLPAETQKMLAHR